MNRISLENYFFYEDFEAKIAAYESIGNLTPPRSTSGGPYCNIMQQAA